MQTTENGSTVPGRLIFTFSRLLISALLISIVRPQNMQNVMQSIFWGLTIEISIALISSLENVKISLLGTVQPFSVVYMLYIFLRKKCGIAQ